MTRLLKNTLSHIKTTNFNLGEKPSISLVAGDGCGVCLMGWRLYSRGNSTRSVPLVSSRILWGEDLRPLPGWCGASLTNFIPQHQGKRDQAAEGPQLNHPQPPLQALAWAGWVRVEVILGSV